MLSVLARKHEVRQFCFSRRRGRGTCRTTQHAEIPGGYRRWRRSDPVAHAVLSIGLRTWPRAPILGGVALSLTRPPVLRQLLDWADVVLVSFPWQVRYCRALSPNATLVYASMNVETEKFRSWAQAAGDPFSAAAWLRYVERSERHAVQASDLVLAVSGEDRDGFVSRFGAAPDRVLVVPNGANPAALSRPAPAERAAARRLLGLPDRPVALVVGADIAPNRHGLQWVERLARATHRFSFVVAGEVSRHVREPRVIGLGEVPDIEPFLSAADVGLCPIEYGGGTKTKLLESMAAGLAVVALEHSTRGLAVDHGVHLLVAEASTDALVAALDRLAGDPDLGERLGRAARALVAERYDWATIGAELSHRLEALEPRRAA